MSSARINAAVPALLPPVRPRRGPSAKLEDYRETAPFAVSEQTIAAGADAAFPIPAQQQPRPAARPTTPARPARPDRPRLRAQIGRRGRSVVVFGTAPPQSRVTVRLQQQRRRGERTGYRTVATRRVRARLGSFRVTVPVARRGGLRVRALVGAVQGTTRLSARTHTLRR